MFDESDDDNFMEMEAAEDGAEEYKDLVEEHEDEVKHSRKKPKSNTIEDEGDDDLGKFLLTLAGFVRITCYYSMAALCIGSTLYRQQCCGLLAVILCTY